MSRQMTLKCHWISSRHTHKYLHSTKYAIYNWCKTEGGTSMRLQMFWRAGICPVNSTYIALLVCNSTVLCLACWLTPGPYITTFRFVYIFRFIRVYQHKVALEAIIPSSPAPPFDHDHQSRPRSRLKLTHASKNTATLNKKCQRDRGRAVSAWCTCSCTISS